MPIVFFHHIGEIHGGAGTLDDIEAGPVGPADIVDPAVAGDIGHHLDADAVEVFADQPDLAGQVEVAEDIDAVFGDAAGIAGADQLRAWPCRRPGSPRACCP